MVMIRRSIHGGWASTWTFVAAAASSTVGLGNLWKFAYLAGANGGAGFILIYFCSLVLAAAPVMLAEFLIGSRGRADPVHSMQLLTLESATGRGWRAIGWLGLLVGPLVLSYLSVVGGWVLAYASETAQGELQGLGAREIGTHFSTLLANWQTQLGWHSLFMLLTWMVVALGVRRGLGLTARWTMPLLLLLLIVAAINGMRAGDVGAAVEFMFASRPVDLRADGALTALGQAFFSLSVGMGAMTMYGAYAPDRQPFSQMVAAVVALNVIVAVLAGLAIFPLVFAQHLQPSFGPGLMFVTLPFALGQTGQGVVMGTLFFALVALAALGTAVSLLEPATAWLVQRWRWRRPLAALLLAFVTWAFGIVSIFSFARWSEWRPGGRSVFAWIDWFTADLLLPLSGVLVALFVGWRMRGEGLKDELLAERPGFFLFWRISLRYIAAPAMIAMLGAGCYEMWRSLAGQP